ncbi:MAG: DUF481 domain-containing protein [Gammaproteobacteria bacterium]
MTLSRVTLILTLFIPTAPSAATLVLHNGDTLSGTLITSTPEQIILRHTVLGELSVRRDQIAEMHDTPPGPEQASRPHQAGADEPDADQESQADSAPVAGTVADTLADRDNPDTSSWWTAWKRTFSAGLSGAQGNSDTSLFDLGFGANYEDEWARWVIDSKYLLSETDGTTSEHNLFVSANRDWLEPGSPWFKFALGRFDWDEFKDWDYRLSGTGGWGYTFREDEHFRLLGRAGLGAIQTFGGAREEFVPEALTGLEFTWRINDRQTLDARNTLYLSLRELGEYRNLTGVDWSIRLDRDAGMDLKLSISNEYDSQAVDPVSNYDLYYSAALVWEL